MKGCFREEILRLVLGGLHEKLAVYFGTCVSAFQDEINLHYLKNEVFSLSTALYFQGNQLRVSAKICNHQAVCENE